MTDYEMDRFMAALRPIIDKLNAPAYRAAIELLKAVRLSPSLEVCVALCQGERVPKSRLDPEWVKAYGLR